MATVISPPSSAEQRIVLQNVAWETFERIVADHLDSSVPRFTYDRGVLEIVSPSTEHEVSKQTLTMVVELVAAEQAIDIHDVGSMTFKRDDLKQAFEADVAFYIQREPNVRGRTRIDPAIDPPPDLVIEIDVSRQSMSKLALFASFGVPEVWRVRGRVVTIYTRRVDSPDGYDANSPSLVLPPLTGEILTRFLAESAAVGRAAWVRSVRSWTQGAS